MTQSNTISHWINNKTLRRREHRDRPGDQPRDR